MLKPGRCWQQKWPQSASILDMALAIRAILTLESVISRQPDLMIAQLRAKPALEESGIISKLGALNIPVLFVRL
nr:Solute-binding periplasmic protein of iron/siderophore ABC transporter [Raoultella sp. NCTC 9187]